ncbi:hypothetical protein BC834DRAFT_847318 [Gloeopeniophorella convolvens]|nr:hypothetical protein BC834DRAFT_847318 [Gloeopeniophorella convolvens]
MSMRFFPRHFYQDPNTYTGSDTAVTPPVNVEEFLLGSQLCQLYLDPASVSHIRGTDLGLFSSSQVLFHADAGDEGSVIYDPAISLAQELWPNSTVYNTTLANGTDIVCPLGGYQRVQRANRRDSHASKGPTERQATENRVEETLANALRTPLSTGASERDPTAAGTDSSFNLREDEVEEQERGEEAEVNDVDAPALDRAVCAIGITPEEHRKISDRA